MVVQKPEAAICWCPVCDEGWVMAVSIQPLDLSGCLCSECEAFWHETEVIAEARFTQLSSVAEAHDMKIGDISVEMHESIV